MQTRERAKGRRNGGSFFAVPHNVLQSEQWASLSSIAIKLFMDLGGQYFGSNNGDLTIAWKVMSKKGWFSKQTLYKARDELISKGFLIVTRQGGRNIPTLYGLTINAIDECIDKKTKRSKLDVKPTRTAPNLWKQN